MKIRPFLGKMKRMVFGYGRLLKYLAVPWKQLCMTGKQAGEPSHFYLRLRINQSNNRGLFGTFVCLLLQREKWSIVVDDQQRAFLPWFFKNSQHVCAIAQINERQSYYGQISTGTKLYPYALTCFCKEINKGAAVVYSDQIVCKRNQRESPVLLRPGFNLEFFRSCNYIGDVVFFRAELLEESLKQQWFSGDISLYEMALRLSRKTICFERVPMPLYSSKRAYAEQEEKEILTKHIQEMYPDCKVSTEGDSFIHRISYPISKETKVSIIIPNRDHPEDLRKCVTSIIECSTWKNYEILVVENGSTKPEIQHYYEELQQEERVRILNWLTDFNYAGINNWAAQQAEGQFLLFLNNDVEVISPGWIEEMLMHAQRAGVGAVGAKLLYPDGMVQHGGVIIGIAGVAGHAYKHLSADDMRNMGQLQAVRNSSAVTGACMMVKRNRYFAVNGMDEALAVAYNDVDLCLRLHARGWNNVYTPYAVLYHYESKTRGAEEGEKQKRFEQEVAWMKQRWHKKLMKGDPYHHPYYSKDDEQYRLL